MCLALLLQCLVGYASAGHVNTTVDISDGEIAKGTEIFRFTFDFDDNFYPMDMAINDTYIWVVNYSIPNKIHQFYRNGTEVTSFNAVATPDSIGVAYNSSDHTLISTNTGGVSPNIFVLYLNGTEKSNITAPYSQIPYGIDIDDNTSGGPYYRYADYDNDLVQCIYINGTGVSNSTITKVWGLTWDEDNLCQWVLKRAPAGQGDYILKLDTAYTELDNFTTPTTHVRNVEWDTKHKTLWLSDDAGGVASGSEQRVYEVFPISPLSWSYFNYLNGTAISTGNATLYPTNIDLKNYTLEFDPDGTEFQSGFKVNITVNTTYIQNLTINFTGLEADKTYAVFKNGSLFYDWTHDDTTISFTESDWSSNDYEVEPIFTNQTVSPTTFTDAQTTTITTDITNPSNYTTIYVNVEPPGGDAVNHTMSVLSGTTNPYYYTYTPTMTGEYFIRNWWALDTNGVYPLLAAEKQAEGVQAARSLASWFLLKSRL